MISDRRLMQRLLLSGRSSVNLPGLVGSLQFTKPEVRGEGPVHCKGRRRLAVEPLRELFNAVCEQYPRIATFAGDTLSFRGFPEQGSSSLVKMHNDLMECARVSVREVSDTRLAFLRKSAPPPQPASRAPVAAPSAGGGQLGEADALAENLLTQSQPILQLRRRVRSRSPRRPNAARRSLTPPLGWGGARSGNASSSHEALSGSEPRPAESLARSAQEPLSR